MAKQAREIEQEFLSTIEATTGKTLPGWMDTLHATGEHKTNSLIKWLKAEYPLNHRQASMLAGIYLNDGQPVYDYAVMFANLFADKEAQRPLYERVVAAIAAELPAAEFIPTKTYVSIEAERVFACVKINKTNLRVGLDLGDAPFTEHLIPAKGLGAMPNIAHMIELQHPDEVDEAFINAVCAAYALHHRITE